MTYQVSYVGGNGNDVTLTVTALDPQFVFQSWDGGGANRLWSNSTNWTGNLAPVATNSLRFARNALNAICTNNFTSNTVFQSLRFYGTATTNNYPLLRGAGIQLLSGIYATNLGGGGSVVVEMPIKLGASQMFTNDATSTIVELRSNLVVAPFVLTLQGQGSFRTTGTVTGTNNATLISLSGGALSSMARSTGTFLHRLAAGFPAAEKSWAT